MRRQNGQVNRMIFIVAGLVLALFAFSAVGLIGNAFANTQVAEAQRGLDGLVSVVNRGCQQNLADRDPTLDLPNIKTIEVTNGNTLKGTLQGGEVVVSTADACGKVTIKSGGTMQGGMGVEVKIEYDHYPNNDNKNSVAHLSRVNN